MDIDLDLATGFLLECLDSQSIGTDLVATGGEKEIDGLASPVNGTVQALPLPFELDVSLVRPTSCRPQTTSCLCGKQLPMAT